MIEIRTPSDQVPNPLRADLSGINTKLAQRKITDGRYGTKTGGESNQVTQNVCSVPIADPLTVAKGI